MYPLIPDHDVALARDALRADLRARRRALPAATRIAGAERLAERLFALPGLPASGYVAGYWAMDGEIGLHAWQMRLPAGLVYCLPMLDEPGKRLRFAPWRPGDPLVTNRHGIPEPDVSLDSALDGAEMALVIVPLVGFAADGTRLGMGGGWYDRTFAAKLGEAGAGATAAASPRLVGVGFEAQRVDSLPAQAWDVPLDAVCTEAATYPALALAPGTAPDTGHASPA